MKNKLVKTIFFILLSLQVFSQKNKDKINSELLKLYNTSQSYYNIDDELVNGCQYVFPSKNIYGNPFLNNKEWNDSKIFINSKVFSKYQLKYDLVNNDIVLKVNFEGGIKRFIGLNKFNIDSFSLKSSIFVNSKVLLPNESEIVFYEQIFRGNISMYKSYNKRFINLYDEMSPNGKFSAIKTNLYLLNNGEFYNVNNQYSFLHFFKKQFRKEIKTYLNNYNIKIKTASNNQLKGLMDYCNKLTK